MTRCVITPEIKTSGVNMKTLLLLALFSTSLLANAKYDVLIITSDTTFGPVIGFTDSSFNYEKNDLVRERKFCYREISQTFVKKFKNLHIICLWNMVKVTMTI